MFPRKLPNYIRAHRKHCGLSQDEVAFLLGGHEGASISRYEHFTRQPNLETAIALEILFQTPVRGLFEGVSEKVERKIARRAKDLLLLLKQRPQDRTNIRKVETLEVIRARLGEAFLEGI
jgi:transcriptional regulator with XRE-family HTH domain